MKRSAASIVLRIYTDAFVPEVTETESRIALSSCMHAVNAFSCFCVRVGSDFH
jgi:hypothetical protein